MSGAKPQSDRSARGLALIAAEADEQRALLRQLVNIDSPSDDPAGVDRVRGVLAEYLDGLGLLVEGRNEDGFGAQLLAETIGVAPRALLMAHMDTVFPQGTVGQRPYREDDRRAYGPGVADDKGGLVCILLALKALLRSGHPLASGVRVFLNSDEEPGSPVSRRWLPEVSRGIAWAAVAEPSESGGRVCVERKGVGIFRLRVLGRAAHAGSNPHEGINAALEASHLAVAAAALANAELGTTVNVGAVHGGGPAYVVPDSAEVTLDVRVWNTAERARIQAALQTLAAVPHLPGARTEVLGSFHRPPMQRVPGLTDALLDRLRSAAARLGQTVAVAPSGGASDGNLLTDAGVPTIDGLGPVGGWFHSPDEYLELDSLTARTQLLYLLLAEDLIES